MNGEIQYTQWCRVMRSLVKVVKVGDYVKKFKVGDTAGVGVLVDSCRVCKHCMQDPRKLLRRRE
jgi:D-arabinose 1-dehydrogenase-like Zn-dependent alcohol dehydrogenase